MKFLIFQHHLFCRAPAGGLAADRTGRSGLVCCRADEAVMAVKKHGGVNLPALTFSLPDFHLTISQVLALRSLYFEDKLRENKTSA